MTIHDVLAVARIDIDHAHRVAVEAAEQAGALLRERARGEIGLRAKGPDGDVVTDLDIAAERLIVDRIHASFPGHQVISEEAGVLGGESSFTWVVDPLDGTNNLAVGMSTYVVGIALCENGVPVLGVVHDPVHEQTFSAARGRGAYGPGGRVLRPALRSAPHRPLLAWIQGHAVASDDSTARALKLVLDAASRRVFQLWAPLLSWAMLARGDIDGIVGYRTEAVDLPAGVMLAVEAGMVVCDLDGAPFDCRIGMTADDRSFVAGRPEDIGRLVDMVGSARRIQPTVKELSVPGPAVW